MTRVGWALLVTGLAGLTPACGDSVDASSGAGEPLIVNNGQFFLGAFPAERGGPAITSLSGYRSTIIPAGTVSKGIGGSAGPGALSIAVALDGLGEGYWVTRVGSPDQEMPGDLTWKTVCTFAPSIPAGTQQLRFAAANRDGQFGPQRTLEVVTLPRRPEGHVVASLTWGNDADLDLHLIGPSGKELDPKHPSSTELDDAHQPLPGAGTLDRDSNANCVPDGYRAENVVWPVDAAAPPEPGTYTVRVDLFSACARPAANFAFDLYIDGRRTVHQAGILLDRDADNGGPGSGLYVTQFTL